MKELINKYNNIVEFIEPLHLYDTPGNSFIRSGIWIFTAIISLYPTLSIQSVFVFYVALVVDIYDKCNDKGRPRYAKGWFGLLSFACLAMIILSLITIGGGPTLPEGFFRVITIGICVYIGIDALLKRVLLKEVRKEDNSEQCVEKYLEKMNTGELGNLKDGELNE